MERTFKNTFTEEAARENLWLAFVARFLPVAPAPAAPQPKHPVPPPVRR